MTSVGSGEASKELTPDLSPDRGGGAGGDHVQIDTCQLGCEFQREGTAGVVPIRDQSWEFSVSLGAGRGVG